MQINESNPPVAVREIPFGQLFTPAGPICMRTLNGWVNVATGEETVVHQPSELDVPVRPLSGTLTLG